MLTYCRNASEIVGSKSQELQFYLGVVPWFNDLWLEREMNSHTITIVEHPE